MALLPTLLAICVGSILGVRWGGQLGNLAAWRPPLWQFLVGGVAVMVAIDVLPVSGGFVTFCWLAAAASVLFFAVVNVRVGGMVLIVAGLGLNVVVTLLNWGMPVSASALESAGIIGPDELDTVALNGGRVLADGPILGFLGHVIALPWGHVVSIGDIVILVGLTLVTSSVVRRYEVGGGHGGFQGRGGPSDYRNALDALGRGPAPRRGPGLHPSRMRGTQRRRPGSGPR